MVLTRSEKERRIAERITHEKPPVSPSRRRTPEPRQEASPPRRNASPLNQRGSPQRHDVSQPHRRVSPPNHEARQDEPPQRRSQHSTTSRPPPRRHVSRSSSLHRPLRPLVPRQPPPSPRRYESPPRRYESPQRHYESPPRTKKQEELQRSPSHRRAAPSSRATSTRKSRAITTKSERARLLAEVREEIAEKELNLAKARLARIEADSDTESETTELSQDDEAEANSKARTEEWIRTTKPLTATEGATKAPAPPLHTATPKKETAIEVSELTAAIMEAARALQPKTEVIRQGSSVELPIFNGAHTDWLNFKMAYEDLTVYGSARENTARLRRALRGRAKEEVEDLLAVVSKPEDIMKALENRFGRPQVIAELELEKIENIQRLTDAPRDVCAFANKIQNAVTVLYTLGEEGYCQNPKVLKTLVEKLTPSLRYRWYDFKTKTSKKASLDMFRKFIVAEAENCREFAPPENITSDERPLPRQPSQPTLRTRPQRTHQPTQRTYPAHRTNTATETRAPEKQRTCAVCAQPNHSAYGCETFKKASNDEKWRLAKEKQLCFRCLGSRSYSHRCQLRRCGENGCTKTHHRLLHYERRTEAAPAPPPPLPPPQPAANIEPEIVATTKSRRATSTYLKIIPVRVTGQSGYIDTHALLDDGSTVTLIDAAIAAKIGADGPADTLAIETVSGREEDRHSRRVTLQLQGNNNVFTVQARTIEKLRLAPQTVTKADVVNAPHLRDIENYVYYERATPTLLIGQDNWHMLVAEQVRRGRVNQPAASFTPLGWVLHGATNRSRKQRVHYVAHVNVRTVNEDTDRATDEATKQVFTPEPLCIQPKKPTLPPEDLALKQLTVAPMKKGDDTEAAPPVTDPGCTCYLPHSAEFRPASDAAASYSSTSLDNQLISGSDLLQSLPEVLTSFNQHEVTATAADSEEIFTQNEDRSALQFLWRNDRRENPHEEYRMKSFSGSPFPPEEEWPRETVTNIEITVEENITPDAFARATPVTVEIATPDVAEALPEITRFSSWHRLIRTTARILQFIDALKIRIQRVEYKRTKPRAETDPQWRAIKTDKKLSSAHQKPRPPSNERAFKVLSADFIRHAEQLWVTQSQRESFGKEITALRAKQASPTDRLKKLTVYVDENETLRLKSRITAAADISSEVKAPAVLDGDHPYTKLYIASIHRQMAHGSTEITVNEVRQRYWVLRLRPTTRRIVKSCLVCRIKKTKPAAPPTGDHPHTRLGHHQRPFTFVGLDYFGPITVTVGRRHEKRYVALFTCLTTRALHLEVAASLSGDSAVMALRRFIARRGCPAEIYSDNGTNMHAADRELRDAAEEEASRRAIRWKFICPSSPFMGGCWERLVKSVKTALQKTLTEQHPTEECLHTLLAEAEYVVNSRPLTHVSVEATDEEALTPNHFLLGGSARTPPTGTYTDADLSGRAAWRRAQRLADHFWARWVREYLPELQHRREPHGRGPAISVGDVVLIADGNLPRNVWPRGLVTELHPGPDGVTRVVDVRTRGGVLRRPVKKLIVLPTTPAPD